MSQQNKTRNETNLDNTCTYYLLKYNKKRRSTRKETTKEKGSGNEMYVLALPHKLFKCLLPKPKTLCMLLLIFLSPNSPSYKSTLSLFPKQTNKPKPCKSKCCKIIYIFQRLCTSKVPHIC